MGETLTFEYDVIGDFLFLDVCKPYANQDSDGLGDDIVARFNLETGEIETVEILFFYYRVNKENEIRIPISASLRPANGDAMDATAPSAANAPMTIKYGHDSDMLALYLREPGPGQIEAEICDGATARLDPDTGEIESLTVCSFKARVERDGEIVLPVKATFRPAKSPVAAD